MMDHPKSGLHDFGRIRCASRINPTCVVKPGGDACGPHPASRRTQRRLARSYGAGPTGPRPMLKAPMLLAAVLVVCVASSADARRRHHHGYYDYGESVSTRDDGRRARYDEWRRGRDRDDWRRSRDREDGARRREAARSDAVMRPGRGGPFAAVVEKLVRGCGQQGAEFENWPFDAIAQIVGADEAQRRALEGLRESAKAAAERLAADCPRDVPAAPSARLEAVEQGIDAALAAFDQVQPALATFYGALDDEQKARLYRDMAAPAATARETTPRRAAP